MEYLTSKETAESWGIGKCRVDRLAREGRIDGAVLFGKNWMIPKNATKPVDGRTRSAKNTPKEETFRFPLFINTDAKDYSPPFTAEEKQLAKAQEDFFACRFEEAYRVFLPLSARAKNRYVRICAITFMAVLATCYDSTIDWEDYFHKLNSILAEDFPHNGEMGVFLPWLLYFSGLYGSVGENIRYNPENNYTSTANYLNAFLSSFCLYSKGGEDHRQHEYSLQYEILCRMAEQEGHFLQAQQLHRALFLSYFLSHRESGMLYHLRRVLRIAEDHRLFYDAADIVHYYPNAVEKVAEEFSPEFIRNITVFSENMAKNYAEISKKFNITDIYSCLSGNDYQFLLYLSEGYSNKEIADMTHFSMQTVSNRISEIFDKLNIKNRQELIVLFKKCIRLV